MRMPPGLECPVNRRFEILKWEKDPPKGPLTSPAATHARLLGDQYNRLWAQRTATYEEYNKY